MDDKEKARLEAGGFKITTVEEFLDLTPADVALIDTRLYLMAAIRDRRMAQGLSQQALADKMGSSQSRVNKIEKADSKISMDLLLRALFALGATPKEVGEIIGQVTERSGHALPK